MFVCFLDKIRCPGGVVFDKNFVIFHPLQKKVSHAIDIKISNKTLREQKIVKYLGVVLDSNLNWNHPDL